MHPRSAWAGIAGIALLLPLPLWAESAAPALEPARTAAGPAAPAPATVAAATTAAAAATTAAAPAAADWLPPLPAADPLLSLRENCLALFNLLAARAAGHPELQLLAHHYRSLALLVEADGAAAQAQVAKLYQAYTAGWGQGPTSWQAYLDGRPLILAWRSPYDGAPMLTTVVLPKGFQDGVSYPLYLELHAVSPGDSALQRLSFALIDHAQGQAGIRRDGFHVYPWNRGLTEYHGPGELGLQECLAQIDQYLDTDPARQYLFGFSMGGGGTWNFGSISQAERGWAALGIYSCTTSPNPFEASALRHTPVWACCGETDPWRKHSEKLNLLLTQAGNPPDFTVVQGVGHSYLGDQQGHMLDFLKAHANPHPVLPVSRSVMLRVFGDDEVEDCRLNGQQVALERSGTGLASIHEGENVIAVHVRNRCWAGGLAFSLATPGVTVVSDATWTCVLAEPGAGWTAPGFDDRQWPPAQAICPVRDFMGTGHSPLLAAIADAGGALLGPPAVMHYRMAFDSAGGPARVLIRGVGLGSRLWLNGQAIGGGPLTSVGKALPAIACATNAGTNVLAVETTSDQPKGGGAFMKCCLFHATIDGGLARVGSGLGWRASAVPFADTAWTANTFDDAAWIPTDASWINSCYDGGADGSGDGTFSAYFMAPGELYFRKRFTAHLEAVRP